MRGLRLPFAVALVAIGVAQGARPLRGRKTVSAAFGNAERGSEAYSFLMEQMKINGDDEMGAIERSQAAYAPPAHKLADGGATSDEALSQLSGGAPKDAKTKTMTFGSGTVVHVYAPRELDLPRMKLVADRVANITGGTTAVCFCKFAARPGRDDASPFGNVDCLCNAKKTGAPMAQAPSPVAVDMYGERVEEGESPEERFMYPLQGEVELVKDALLLSLDAGDKKSWDGVSGRWRDVGGSEFAGEVEGNVSLDPDEETGALRFGRDGGDDRILVRGFDMSPATHPSLSIEVWVKLHSTPNKKGYLIGNDNGNGDLDRAVYMHDTSFAEGGAEPGAPGLGAGAPYVSTMSAPQMEKWMQVVGVWNQDGPSYMYRNNVRSSGVDVTINKPGSATLSIGAHQFLEGQHVDASIAVVRVYGRALKEAEVQQNFDFMASRFRL